MLMLEGRVKMALGDEERVIERGDLVHIPRNTRHGIRVVQGPAVFFTVKSPVAADDASIDYSKAEDAEQVWSRLSST
jgi:quercetin dioxygenase-like cupin family protein